MNFEELKTYQCPEKDIARWANRAWLFKAMDFLDFEPRKGFKCAEYFK